MKTYEINITLNVDVEAQNEEEARKQAHDFLMEVSNQNNLTDDELEITECE